MMALHFLWSQRPKKQVGQIDPPPLIRIKLDFHAVGVKREKYNITLLKYNHLPRTLKLPPKTFDPDTIQSPRPPRIWRKLTGPLRIFRRLRPRNFQHKARKKS